MSDRSARPATLIALFRTTAQLMIEELVERLHAAGYDDTTSAHHPVFENIDRAGTRVTVLAERTGMSHQSMSELVQTLVQRGYLERQIDPADGRAKLVRLTGKGRAMARQALKEIPEIEAAWLERYRRASSGTDLRALLESGLSDRAAEDSSSSPGGI